MSSPTSNLPPDERPSDDELAAMRPEGAEPFLHSLAEFTELMPVTSRSGSPQDMAGQESETGDNPADVVGDDAPGSARHRSPRHRSHAAKARARSEPPPVRCDRNSIPIISGRHNDGLTLNNAHLLARALSGRFAKPTPGSPMIDWYSSSGGTSAFPHLGRPIGHRECTCQRLRIEVPSRPGLL
jgi:hypothetical protein